MKSLGWKVANAVMAVAFAASVAVQYNDPDPFAWMAIYGAAAVMAALETIRPARPIFPGMLAAVALVWAATLGPRVLGKVPFGDMFAEFEMKHVGIEESREMYGLLWIAVWMIVVAIAGWRRRA